MADNENTDFCKGYKLHVTPQLRTRLKVLKLRNKVFQTKEEAESQDYELHEAIVLPIIKTYRELGFDIPEPKEGEVATDFGPLKGEQLELYYQFLEIFRSIIEDPEVSNPKKIELVDSLDGYERFSDYVNGQTAAGFLRTELSKELSEINGMPYSAIQELFAKGIFTKSNFFKMTDEQIRELNGVGTARQKKILKEKEIYLKQFE